MIRHTGHGGQLSGQSVPLKLPNYFYKIKFYPLICNHISI